MGVAIQAAVLGGSLKCSHSHVLDHWQVAPLATISQTRVGRLDINVHRGRPVENCEKYPVFRGMCGEVKLVVCCIPGNIDCKGAVHRHSIGNEAQLHSSCVPEIWKLRIELRCIAVLRQHEVSVPLGIPIGPDTSHFCDDFTGCSFACVDISEEVDAIYRQDRHKEEIGVRGVPDSLAAVPHELHNHGLKISVPVVCPRYVFIPRLSTRGLIRVGWKMVHYDLGSLQFINVDLQQGRQIDSSMQRRREGHDAPD
mmetsp:Transcript_51605/g.120391  ORF Transcript_51605/g.120391 Transcript_51605/m.120391 type:complete len:254 (+) Transcript_51605:624-1385(+)